MECFFALVLTYDALSLGLPWAHAHDHQRARCALQLTGWANRPPDATRTARLPNKAHRPDEKFCVGATARPFLHPVLLLVKDGGHDDQADARGAAGGGRTQNRGGGGRQQAREEDYQHVRRRPGKGGAHVRADGGGEARADGHRPAGDVPSPCRAQEERAPALEGQPAVRGLHPQGSSGAPQRALRLRPAYARSCLLLLSSLDARSARFFSPTRPNFSRPHSSLHRHSLHAPLGLCHSERRQPSGPLRAREDARGGGPRQGGDRRRRAGDARGHLDAPRV